MNGSPLSEDERQEAIAAFRKVFAADMAHVDVYGAPFQHHLPARTILYPVGPELDDDELDAVARAAEAIGDDGFYVSVVGFLEAERLDWHWYVPLSGLTAYDSLDVTYDSALYSPSGRWGMLVSLEEHAIVGGTPEFLERLLAEYPERAPGWLIHGLRSAAATGRAEGAGSVVSPRATRLHEVEARSRGAAAAPRPRLRRARRRASRRVSARVTKPRSPALVYGPGRAVAVGPAERTQ